MKYFSLDKNKIELARIMVEETFKKPVNLINLDPREKKVEFYTSPEFPEEIVGLSERAIKNIEESLSTTYGSKILGVERKGNIIKIKTEKGEIVRKKKEFLEDVSLGAYLKSRYLCRVYGIETVGLEEVSNALPLEAIAFLSNLEERIETYKPLEYGAKGKLRIKRNSNGILRTYFRFIKL